MWKVSWLGTEPNTRVLFLAPSIVKWEEWLTSATGSFPELSPWAPKGLDLESPGVVRGMTEFPSVPTLLPLCLWPNDTFVRALGHPVPRPLWKNVHFITSRALSPVKAGCVERFVGKPHLPFQATMTCYRENRTARSTNKMMDFWGDCQLLLWTEQYLMDQKAGEGLKRTTAFFWRSKVPKVGRVNVQNASKQRQWESLTTGPCWYFVTFPAPNIMSRLWLRNAGCREKHTLLHGSFKRQESHVKRRRLKFQASCYLSYKFLILIVSGIFRTTVLHVVVLS